MKQWNNPSHGGKKERRERVNQLCQQILIRIIKCTHEEILVLPLKFIVLPLND